MTTAVLPQSPARKTEAIDWLKLGSRSWLAVALVGQGLFALYVLLLYGGAVVRGQLQDWNATTPRGYAPGDTLGNLIFGSHMLFTVVVVFGAMLQLLPAIRRHAPALHRWNGRVYLLSATTLAIGGIVLMTTRGTVGNFWQHFGTALNSVVIIACAAMAWHHARGRRFEVHRRWALRLFMVVSGVWFFRVGLMAWMLSWRAPVGFDPKTFSGPFLTTLAYAQFMLPLAVLELVWRVQASGGRRLRMATAGLVFALAALTALGIVGASLMMWWPKLR